LMKKVSKLFSFLLAIYPCHAIVSPVASATLNNNTTTNDNDTKQRRIWLEDCK